jgi:hypothetical protein
MPYTRDALTKKDPYRYLNIFISDDMLLLNTRIAPAAMITAIIAYPIKNSIRFLL